MRIGIIGAGNIGGNLGRAWARKEHQIRFGVRDPGKIGDLLRECGGRAQAADPASAAAFGDVVALTVPWSAALETVSHLGSLSGKVVVDCTNPIVWQDGPVHAHERSGAQAIAERCPGARVVKAFNCVGAEHLLDPRHGNQSADMFIAGDDAEAKRTVSSLAQDLGFDVIDAGPLRNARLLEHLAALWIHLAMVGGHGRDIAFKLLKR